jgi:replication-associated recombination protein RarA
MTHDTQLDPWVNVTTHSGLHADEVISSLQKEIRRGEVENAVKVAYEMIRTSPELEAKLWQRLKVISVEDIGWGDLKAPRLIETLDRFHLAFERGQVDRVLFAVHAVRYLCSRPKDRSSDEMTQWVTRGADEGQMAPAIPDYALDQHTQRGRTMGRSRRHFYEEASRVIPELADRDTTYLEKLLAGLDNSEA